MRAYAVLFAKDISEQLRTGRLPVVAVIFLLFGLGSPVLAKYTPDIARLAAGSIALHVPTPTIRDAVAQLIKNVGQLGVLVSILLAMGSVASEKAAGTAAFVLVKPVSRVAFLGAKFSGLALTLSASVLVCGAAAYFYTNLLFAPPSLPGFAAACLVLLLGLLELAAVTFLGSTLVRSAVPAAAIGVVALIISGILSSIPNVGRFTPSELNTLAGKLALQQPVAGWEWPLVANAGVLIVCLGASWLAFRRQEI